MTTERASTVVYIATSLDGFLARPDGSLDWLPQPETGEDYGWAEFLSGVDALVMGRSTFEKVLEFDAWPYEGTPVIVLSRSLDRVPAHLEAHAEIRAGAPQELLQQLAAEGRRRVYVDGGRVIQSLLRDDLIDELVLSRIPVLIGAGIPLFGELPNDLSWRHQGSTAFANGVVKDRYLRQR